MVACMTWIARHEEQNVIHPGLTTGNIIMESPGNAVQCSRRIISFGRTIESFHSVPRHDALFSGHRPRCHQLGMFLCNLFDIRGQHHQPLPSPPKAKSAAAALTSLSGANNFRDRAMDEKCAQRWFHPILRLSQPGETYRYEAGGIQGDAAERHLQVRQAITSVCTPGTSRCEWFGISKRHFTQGKYPILRNAFHFFIGNMSWH